MATKGDKKGGVSLKPVHLEAIERIVAGESVTEVAKTIGVSRQHLSGLVNQNPFFMAALETRQSEALRELRENLRAALFTAVQTAVELLQDGKTPEGVRLQTAVSLTNRLAPLFLGDIKVPRTAEGIAESIVGAPVETSMKDLLVDIPKRDRLLKDAQLELSM